MKSMTGYGKAVVLEEGRELSVELKSVNHRFLDISTKMPRAFLAYEDLVRSVISGKISRGHVDVVVNYRLTGNSDNVAAIDFGLAKSYVDASVKLREEFPELRDDFTLYSLMRCPDVVKLEQVKEDEAITRDLLGKALAQAVDNLNVMRENEGNKLRDDLLTKIAVVETLLEKVREKAPTVVDSYREKLRKRIEAALDNIAVDEAKLANEVCFFADKTCIDEEITRLTSHIGHAREILSSVEPIGRKMDFLVQEFNRETNTICSKSNCVDLTNIALEMKNEIEKMREQVQNLE